MGRGTHQAGELRSMEPKRDREGLLLEIEELGKEIEEIKKRIPPPPHTVRYEIIQLLEEKEIALERKKAFLQSL